jgi:NTE family protein
MSTSLPPPVPDAPRLGLVLAGGGAKGAYQVGALEYLVELGIAPSMMAGTSIGAMNCSVIASEPTFARGVDRLGMMWDRLGRARVLAVNPALLGRASLAVARQFGLDALSGPGGLFIRQWNGGTSLFDPKLIEDILGNAIDPAAIRSCPLEVWVTAFRSLGAGALGHAVRRLSGARAEWFRLQDFEEPQIRDVVLASAAIPFAFPERKIGEAMYVDGGIADNAPLGALAARGCRVAIVVHLGNGEVWNRHDFGEQTVIEIRPQQPIQESEAVGVGWIQALLDFSAERIVELRRRGREDAERAIRPLLQTLQKVDFERNTRQLLIATMQRIREDGPLE